MITGTLSLRSGQALRSGTLPEGKKAYNSLSTVLLAGLQGKIEKRVNQH